MEISLWDGRRVPLWEGWKCEEHKSFPRVGRWSFYIEDEEIIVEVWDVRVIFGRGS